MTQEPQRLFKLVDDYSRSHYKCFLAEMFLDQSQTEYICCFRPTQAAKGTANQWACKYLRIDRENTFNIDEQLSFELKDQLDNELSQFAESQK